MKADNQFIAQVKNTIENLIEAGTSFDINQLELIYHKDLKVIMVDEEGQKMISDKISFKKLFETKKKNGDPSLNTWKEYIHLEATSDHAHVIINRKVNLTGEERKLMLSIDLVFESNRWQVTREVIFSKSIK